MEDGTPRIQLPDIWRAIFLGPLFISFVYLSVCLSFTFVVYVCRLYLSFISAVHVCRLCLSFISVVYVFMSAVYVYRLYLSCMSVVYVCLSCVSVVNVCSLCLSFMSVVYVCRNEEEGRRRRGGEGEWILNLNLTTPL